MAQRKVKRRVHHLLGQETETGRHNVTTSAFRQGVRSLIYKRSFRAFVYAGWEHADGKPIHWNWHLGVLADHLQALYEGRLDDAERLKINIPPGMAKSMVTSVLWPAWVWLHDPTRRFLVVSANKDVLTRDSMKCHQLVESDWYQHTFHPRWTFSTTQDTKEFWQLTSGGFRQVKTTGQKITGNRGNVIIIDDPIDAAEAYADKQALAKATHYYRNTLSSRDDRGTMWVVVMQRLHPEDLSGYIDQNEAEWWVSITLPMEYDGQARRSPLGYYDPRKKEGELLFPWLRDEKSVKHLKETMDPGEWMTQWQQNAAAKGVGVVKIDAFRYWTPRQMPEEFEQVIISADLTAKTKGSRSRDWAVLQVWGRALQEYYFLDQSRERTFTISGMAKKIVGWCLKRKEIDTIAIENRALAEKVIALLKKQLRAAGVTWVRIVPVDPQGASKQERYSLIEPLLLDGQVLIPDPARYPWVQSVFLRELAGFPYGSHDDQVDAMTQAVIYLARQADGRSKKKLGFALAAQKGNGR